MLPIVGSTIKMSSKILSARKKRSRTCLRTDTKMPLAIWVLYSGSGNLSGTSEGRAVKIRRNSFSERALVMVPVSNGAKFSYSLNFKMYKAFGCSF